jgi:hypothetical protein
LEVGIRKKKDFLEILEPKPISVTKIQIIFSIITIQNNKMSQMSQITTFLEMGFLESTVTEAVSRFPSQPDNMLNWLLVQPTVGQVPKKIKLGLFDTRTVTYYGSKVKWKGLLGTIDGFDIVHSVVRFNPRQHHLVRKWLHVSDSSLEWLVCHHNSIPINNAPHKMWRRQVGTVEIPFAECGFAMSEYGFNNGLLSSEDTNMLTLWLKGGMASVTHRSLWEAMDGFTYCHAHYPSGPPPRYSPKNMKPILTSLNYSMGRCRHELRIELMSYFLTLCDFYAISMQNFTEHLVQCNEKNDFLQKVITLFPADFDPRKGLYLRNEYTFLEMCMIWLDPTSYILTEVEEYHSKSLPMVDFETDTSTFETEIIRFKVFFHDMTFVMPSDQNKAIVQKHFQTLFCRLYGDGCRPIPVNSSLDAFWKQTLELSKKNHQTKTQPSDVFVSELLPFQQKVVNWMQMRESTAPPLSSMAWQRHQLDDGFAFYTDKFGSLSYTRPSDAIRGGILAQSSGLGKTVEMLALIASSECTKPTLVIMAPETLKVWIKEAAKHAPSLKICKYHGSKRNLKHISNVHIVLTTFRIVNNDKVGIKNDLNLKDIDWGRMVIDDFDRITPEPLYSLTPLQCIHADLKWCMSDNIFKSRISAVGTLFRVFQMTPFNQNFTNNKEFNTNNGLIIREMLVEMTYSQTAADVDNELPKPIHDISLYQDNIYSTACKHLINAIRVAIADTTSERRLVVRGVMRRSDLSILKMWMGQVTVHPGIVPIHAFAETDHDNSQHSSTKTSIEGFLDSLEESLCTTALQGLVESCTTGQENCSICMGEIERPTLTKCNHVFCYECIQSCYEHDPLRKKCPLCRNSGVGSTLVELTSGKIVEDLFFRITSHGMNYKIEKNIYDEIVAECAKTGSNKMDYILQNVAASGKTVIYTNSNLETCHIMDILNRQTEIYGLCISNLMNRTRKDDQIWEFSNNANISIIVMDVAIHNDKRIILDAADNIVFIRPCNYGRQRALDRVIRIGRDRSVKVLTLKTRNSIDDLSFDETFSSFQVL